MEIIFYFLACLLVVHGHNSITHVTPVYSTVTKTIIPSCYEPAENLNFCYRRKRQLLLYDPVEYAPAELPTSLAEYEVLPVDDQSQAKSGGAGKHLPDYHEQPEIVPSFQQYQSHNGVPGEFLNYLAGFVTKTKTTILVTATVTAHKTQTLVLDCIHPGSYVPANFCDVSMIFPAPPEGLPLSQYCNLLGQLGKVRVDACEEVSLSTGLSIYIRFGKGPYGPYPSRKLIMKYILTGLIKNCNLKAGTCKIPGFPSGWVLQVYDIHIPGIVNINVFISEILIEILGVGNGCPNFNPFTAQYPWDPSTLTSLEFNSQNSPAKADEVEAAIEAHKNKQAASGTHKYYLVKKIIPSDKKTPLG